MGLTGLTYLCRAGRSALRASQLSIAIVLAWVLGLAWMIWLGVVAWRMPDAGPIAWPMKARAARRHTHVILLMAIHRP